MQTVGNATEGGAAAAPATAARVPRPYISFEYVCKFCFKTFKSGHALGGHQNLHRNDEQRELGKYCGLTFGFEDRSKHNAVATPPGAKRVQRRGMVADGSGPGLGLNRHGGLVARDSISAMARARLNNQNQGRRPPPIAPVLQVPGGSTGTESGPGAVYSPPWGAGLNLLTEPGSNSVVGDNFSNHRIIFPPTMPKGGNYYHPYGGFIEDHFGRWKGSFHCPEAATLISECNSMEVSSHTNNGVDLELKL